MPARALPPFARPAVGLERSRRGEPLPPRTPSSAAARVSGRVARLAAVLLLAGCDGSSPTDPDPPRSAATIVFEDADLTAHEGVITELLSGTFERAGRALPLGPVRFVVAADPPRVVPGWGMGGYTHGPTEVEIVVDPAYPGLADALVERLPAVAAHELHHTVRWRTVGPASTLLETMVLEGLADHFALDLTATAPPPWTTALSESQISIYLARALPELDDPGYNYLAWFFGVGTDLPRWTGYTLGFHLVGAYLASHPGSTAASLVATPADAFRPAD